jgi:hypothetical protein
MTLPRADDSYAMATCRDCGRDYVSLLIYEKRLVAHREPWSDKDDRKIGMCENTSLYPEEAAAWVSRKVQAR